MLSNTTPPFVDYPAHFPHRIMGFHQALWRCWPLHIILKSPRYCWLHWVPLGISSCTHLHIAHNASGIWTSLGQFKMVNCLWFAMVFAVMTHDKCCEFSVLGGQESHADRASRVPAALANKDIDMHLNTASAFSNWMSFFILGSFFRSCHCALVSFSLVIVVVICTCSNIPAWTVCDSIPDRRNATQHHIGS